MTARSTYVCDGCCTATVDMPMPDGRARARLVEALHAARWVTPLPGIWLCPACAEITEIEGVKPVETLPMFGGDA